MVELEGSLTGEGPRILLGEYSPGEREGIVSCFSTKQRYLVSFEAISATCLPCQRAPASSISEGKREPSPPAMVLAP